MSERRACQLVSQPRGTQRYQPTQREDEDPLTQAIIELASQYGHYGYRRITALLQHADWRVGKDRVERIWRREGLKVPEKQKPRGRLWLNDGSCVRLRTLKPRVSRSRRLIRGVEGGWVYQGQERHSPGSGVRGTETELRWSSFLGTRYFVSTGGRDETTIREYIRNQEKEDQRLDQMNMSSCLAAEMSSISPDLVLSRFYDSQSTERLASCANLGCRV